MKIKQSSPVIRLELESDDAGMRSALFSAIIDERIPDFLFSEGGTGKRFVAYWKVADVQAVLDWAEAREASMKTDLTNDEIIAIRDNLLTVEAPTNRQQNWLRDCNIALRIVRCDDKTAAEARARVLRYCEEEGVRPPPAVCSTCNDTHMMSLGDREVMCTRCPVPCDQCRSRSPGKVGGGPYCSETPCACLCHQVRRAPMSEVDAYVHGGKYVDPEPADLGTVRNRTHRRTHRPDLSSDDIKALQWLSDHSTILPGSTEARIALDRIIASHKAKP